MAATATAHASTPGNPSIRTTPPPFSRSSSLSAQRSPDTASSVFPERAIRPLPKSRLKSKLSPDQASSIVYPPDPPPISPTLSFAGGKENVGALSPIGRVMNGDVAHGQFLHHRRPPSPSSTHAHHQHHHHESVVHHHSHCTCGEDIDSGDEEVEFDHPDYRYTSTSATTANGTSSTAGDPVLDSVQRRLLEAARLSTTKSASAPHPTSAASSADGYDSFENTSNKKKRKIPLSAASSMHQSQLSAEMASMGISGGGPGNVEGAMDDVHGGRDGLVTMKGDYLPGAGASGAGAAANTGTGTGISGAGRGRYGRQGGRGGYGVRRPLGSSSANSVNGYHPRPAVRSGGDVRGVNDPDLENTGGIISQAIKSAAEQGPITPQKGQELASLLQTATSSTNGNTNNSVSPGANSKTQFTFSVESESANKMIDQQQAAAAAAAAAAAQQQASYASPTPNARGINGSAAGGGSSGGSMGKGTSGQGTQTNRANNASASRAPPSAPPPPNSQQPAPSSAPKPPPPPPKPRRRPSKEYALQARQRRLQQEYSNYHHRPTKENGAMWICEFCEYEDIFGVPPVALIRQYEVKDRAERKRQAEKRRLLEKAKAKGRKKGKGGKGKNSAGGGGGGGNAGGGAQGGVGGQNYDPALLSYEGDEYFDDEEEDDFGDEYSPVPTGGEHDAQFAAEYFPPPVPAGTPQGMGGGGGGGKRGG